jgi:hypothetical protein
MLHFDAFTNKLLSVVRLNYASAYVHIDVVVKSSELSSVDEDLKFEFIRIFCVTAQKLNMKMMYLKNYYKGIRNE